MIITSDQIRAARALLEWSQEDLANKSSLARRTVALIESGKQKPGLDTIEKIISAFDQEDVEFAASEGVRRKAESIRVFTGEDEAYDFFDFLLDHSQKTMDPVYLNSVCTNEYTRCIPGFHTCDYCVGMDKLAGQIDVRFISKENDHDLVYKSYAKYRTVPEEQFNALVPIYVFGDYIAIMLFLDEVCIFLIEDKDAAELYRQKFLEQWEVATPLET